MKQNVPAAAPTEKAMPGAARTCGAILAGLAMALCLAATVVLLFVKGVTQGMTLPAAGPISGGRLTAFLETPYAVAATAVPAAVFGICVVLLQTRRPRRIFFSLSVWCLAAAALLVLLAWRAVPLLQWLPAEWQQLLVGTTRVFGTCMALCALALTAVSATALSVYACIAAAKGGRHEKNS